MAQESLESLEVQVEGSQETVGVGSLVGVLGFPWEGDSNEGGKTFLQHQSAAEKTVLPSRPLGAGLRLGSTGTRFRRAARLGVGFRGPYSPRPQTPPRCAGSYLEVFLVTGMHCARGGRGKRTIERNVPRSPPLLAGTRRAQENDHRVEAPSRT